MRLSLSELSIHQERARWPRDRARWLGELPIHQADDGVSDMHFLASSREITHSPNSSELLKETQHGASRRSWRKVEKRSRGLKRIKGFAAGMLLRSTVHSDPLIHPQRRGGTVHLDLPFYQVQIGVIVAIASVS